MLAAVKKGDAKELAELMGQDPDFNVNTDLGSGRTLLHHACCEDHSFVVIPLLLAHPDIDVLHIDIYGQTPFFVACLDGHPCCVREMLKDSRVKVNEPANYGCTPLWNAACWGHLDIIKLWVASGRETDLGKPGEELTDAIGGAKQWKKIEVVALLERFKENPVETRHALRVELGWYNELAAEMFAMVVFVSDGLLKIKDTTPSPAARFSIARRFQGTPNGAVLSPGGITQGDNPRK